MNSRLRCRSNVFGIRSCFVFHQERLLAEKKRISAVPKSSLLLLFFLCFCRRNIHGLSKSIPRCSSPWNWRKVDFSRNTVLAALSSVISSEDENKRNNSEGVICHEINFFLSLHWMGSIAIIPKKKGTITKQSTKRETITFNQRRGTEAKEPITLQQTNVVGTKRGRAPESKRKFDWRRMWRDNI